MRQERKQARTSYLMELDKDTEYQMQAEAIERSIKFNTTVRGKYSIWRRDYESANADSTLKLMRDQIIMAKVYASIALSKNEIDLYSSLMKPVKESQYAIGEATSDADLHPR